MEIVRERKSETGTTEERPRGILCGFGGDCEREGGCCLALNARRYTAAGMLCGLCVHVCVRAPNHLVVGVHRVQGRAAIQGDSIETASLLLISSILISFVSFCIIVIIIRAFRIQPFYQGKKQHLLTYHSIFSSSSSAFSPGIFGCKEYSPDCSK